MSFFGHPICRSLYAGLVELGGSGQEQEPFHDGGHSDRGNQIGRRSPGRLGRAGAGGRERSGERLRVPPMTTGEREPEMSGQPSSDPGAPPSPGGLTEIRASWIDFYDGQFHRTVRFVMNTGASRQDAQDAVQEAFTQSWILVNSHPDRWLAVTSKEAWIPRWPCASAVGRQDDASGRG
jgi:hypothetical protein